MLSNVCKVGILYKCCRSFAAAASSTSILLPSTKEAKAQFESDTAKLLKYACINYHKDGSNPEILPDSEYPDWLFELKYDSYNIHEMSPERDGWRYWQVRRKQYLEERNYDKMLMSHHFFVQKDRKEKRFRINVFNRKVYKKVKHK